MDLDDSHLCRSLVVLDAVAHDFQRGAADGGDEPRRALRTRRRHRWPGSMPSWPDERPSGS